jgi:hypothetical protein
LEEILAMIADVVKATAIRLFHVNVSEEVRAGFRWLRQSSSQ